MKEIRKNKQYTSNEVEKIFLSKGYTIVHGILGDFLILLVFSKDTKPPYDSGFTFTQLDIVCDGTRPTLVYLVTKGDYIVCHSVDYYTHPDGTKLDLGTFGLYTHRSNILPNSSKDFEDCINILEGKVIPESTPTDVSSLPNASEIVCGKCGTGMKYTSISNKVSKLKCSSPSCSSLCEFDAEKRRITFKGGMYAI